MHTKLCEVKKSGCKNCRCLIFFTAFVVFCFCMLNCISCAVFDCSALLGNPLKKHIFTNIFISFIYFRFSNHFALMLLPNLRGVNIFFLTFLPLRSHLELFWLLRKFEFAFKFVPFRQKKVILFGRLHFRSWKVTHTHFTKKMSQAC